MESVGLKLRNARLRKKLALEDVSAATKINLRNLQAIEDDDIQQISSPFTYRSFARQYANCVQADWAELDSAISESSSRIPAPLMPGQNGAPLPASRQRRTAPSKLRWALSAGSLMLSLGAGSLFYGAWQSAHADIRSSVSSVLARPAIKALTKPVAKALPAAAEAPANSFRIELSAVEKCWLSVMTDGKEVFAGMLQPNETKSLQGQEEARIRTGNAGGVTVNFNGRSLGPLGRRGEVRTVIFNKNGYEVLESSARIVPVTVSRVRE